MLKQVLYAEKEGNQPFLIAGSGTMGWDQVAVNLMEQGDEAASGVAKPQYHETDERHRWSWRQATLPLDSQIGELRSPYPGDQAHNRSLESFGVKVNRVKAEVGGIPR